MQNKFFWVISFLIINFAVPSYSQTTNSMPSPNPAAEAPNSNQSATSDTGHPYRWQDKLARGFVNIISCPLEIPKEITDVTRKKNMAIGWTVGLVEGVGGATIRLGAGLLDLLTFPFNFPDAQKRPLVMPEYVWEDMK